ncbi:unnamed protein product [Lampetra fluviatilis]
MGRTAPIYSSSSPAPRPLDAGTRAALVSIHCRMRAQPTPCRGREASLTVTLTPPRARSCAPRAVTGGARLGTPKVVQSARRFASRIHEERRTNEETRWEGEDAEEAI